MLTGSFQFTLAAGEVIKAEVDQEHMSDVCDDSSHAEEPAQALVKVLSVCTGASITHDGLDSCDLQHRGREREGVMDGGREMLGK